MPAKVVWLGSTQGLAAGPQSAGGSTQAGSRRQSQFCKLLFLCLLYSLMQKKNLCIIRITYKHIFA